MFLEILPSHDSDERATIISAEEEFELMFRPPALKMVEIAC
jgi:hypothetical protein